MIIKDDNKTKEDDLPFKIVENNSNEKAQTSDQNLKRIKKLSSMNQQK